MAYVGRTPANAAITAADLDNGIVTADKLATNAVTTVKVNADAVTNAKTEFTPGLEIKGDGSSADGKITLNCSQNSHGVSITSPAHSAGQSYNLILPTSVGTNGQVLATNGSNTNQLSWVDAVEAKPTVADVSQTIAPNTSQTFNITGTGFVSIPIVEFIKSDMTWHKPTQNFSAQDKSFIESNRSILATIAKLDSISLLSETDEEEESAIALVGEMKLLIPLAGLIDKAAEQERLNKEIEKLLKLKSQFSAKLSNEKFVKGAPEAVVNNEKQKLASTESALNDLESQLEKISNL